MTKTKAAHTPGPQIPENAQDKIFRAYDGGFKPFGHSKGPWVNDNGRILANDGGMGILVAVTQTPVNGLPADVLDANARLIAAAPDLLQACEAHQAWAWAEENHKSTSFNERMELCKYAQWLTVRALAITSGDPAGEKYAGVPHMVIWPAVYIDRADQDEAKAIVSRLMDEWRAAIEKARTAP